MNCRKCGEEIPPERLASVPGTTLCVKCTQRIEKSTANRALLKKSNLIKESRLARSSTGENCPTCGAGLVLRANAASGEAFLGCRRYPDCRFTKKTANPSCPDCKVKLTLRDGRRGKFWGCPNYPRCTFSLAA